MAKSVNGKIVEKGIYTGIIEQDDKNNFFCGSYLLDFKKVMTQFKLGDLVTIKSVIENPSDINYNAYPKKSKNFDKANSKPEH